jgi:predicted RND superfamily exporter protein
MLRKRFFKWLASTVTYKTKIVLFVCFIFTVFMIFASTKIKMKMSFHEMLSKNYPEVQAFYNIEEDFGATFYDFIVIESLTKDIKQMKKCANVLGEKIVNLTSTEPRKDKINSSDTKYNTVNHAKGDIYKNDRKFNKKYGFVVQKKKNLIRLFDRYSALDIAGVIENMNNNLKSEYIENEKELSYFKGEQGAVLVLDGINTYLHGLKEYLNTKDSLKLKRSIDEFINGSEYMLSPDNSLLIMRVVPKDGIPAMTFGNKIKEIISDVNKNFPDLYLGATGASIFISDQMESAKKDFGLLNILSFIMIIVLLIGSFGSWRNPFLAVVTLVIALLWASGFIAIFIQHLNILSIAFFFVLIGLGIDFGIHFISGFRDARLLGLSLEESIKHMYLKYGSGVVTGAFTTAIAFFVLSFTDFRTLTEVGISCGGGILFCMLAMIILLPALIVWNNKGYSVIGNLLRKLHLNFIPVTYLNITRHIGRFFPKNGFTIIKSVFRFKFLEKTAPHINKTPVAISIIIFAFIISVFSILSIKSIGFEYNIMNLEEKGIMSAVNMEKILDKFKMSMEGTMLLASDIEECREKVKELKNIADRTDLIGEIDALSELLPNEITQKENLIKISEFKKQLENQKTNTQITKKDIQEIKHQLQSLYNNIVKISELSIKVNGKNNSVFQKCYEIVGNKNDDNFILKLARELKNNDYSLINLSACQNISAQELKKKLLAKCSDSIVTIDNLPVSIKNRYVNKDNNNFLITVYPKKDIYDKKILAQFNKQIKTVSEAATGFPIIIFLFFRLIIEKGSFATLFAVISIIIFLLIDFRSFLFAILAIVPLLIGSSWIFGVMAIFGIKFNIVNSMVFPLILGIGIDDGVHILHRYKIEGRGNIDKVIKFTGRAILLTSLTTLIVFGSMAFGNRRGPASAGLVLFFGVSFCFLTSVFVLPALICLYEKYTKKWNLKLIRREMNFHKEKY